MDHAKTGNDTNEELYAASVQEANSKFTDFGKFHLAPGSQCIKLTRGKRNMVYYELTIKCPNGCTLSVPSDNMPTYLERHTRICASGDQELHALREALERHDWSNHSVANAMKTVSNKEKYAEFQGDVCTFLGVYSKARELPKHLSQLRDDERLGDRAKKIYYLLGKVTGRLGGESNDLVPHWSWYMPKYHKIWTEFGFEDRSQKKKSAKKSTKRQKTRR